MKRVHFVSKTSICALLLLTLSTLLPRAASAVPAVSFSPKTDFPTGTGAWGVAIGDLNGDGKPDLAVAKPISNTVSVLLGDGHGSFGPYTDFATGTEPSFVAIGDLNGDGKPDLVVTDAASNKVSVLLGYGNGSFGPEAEYPVGSFPAGVVIAGLNGDGKPDLAVANLNYGGPLGSGSVSVLLGDGLGSFGPQTEYPTGGQPWGIAIGDLDGDGKLDIVVTDAGSNKVSVLLGDGHGSLGPAHDFTVDTNPERVVIGDVNGDGNPDLLTANYEPSTVSVLLGDGHGNYRPRIAFATGPDPATVAIGDLNGDGRPDLAAGNWGSAYTGTVSVLLNTSGTTVTPQPPATCITPAHPCVAVPVNITRNTSDQLRAFSVTVRLSSNLTLCPPEIAEGTYLSSVGPTHYEVVDKTSAAWRWSRGCTTRGW